MKNKKFAALAFSALLLCAAGWGVAAAEEKAHKHEIGDTHAYAGHRAGKENVYAPAMEAMHHHMQAETTGDADVDFVRGMIPHHQGAVDMAKILKEKGSDPELQKLADEIIVAQEREIGFMKDWLQRKGY